MTQPIRQAPDHLADLWVRVERMTRDEDPLGLPPVVGGGCTTKPRVALVFINPTARNASTRDGWAGPRWPWLGTRPVWRVLADAGLLDPEVRRQIDGCRTWTEEFAETVYEDVAKRGMYFTNLVKWTGPNGDLPSPRLVRLYEDVLDEELRAVEPQAVVAFGGMTVKALTGHTVKLGQILDEARETGAVPGFAHRQLALTVYPCFFPVGRGNPRGATELLSILARQLGLSGDGYGVVPTARGVL